VCEYVLTDVFCKRCCREHEHCVIGQPCCSMFLIFLLCCYSYKRVMGVLHVTVHGSVRAMHIVSFIFCVLSLDQAGRAAAAAAAAESS